MKKVTEAFLKAQFMLKGNKELSEKLDSMIRLSEALDIEMTPELQEAIDRIDSLLKERTS